MSTQQGRVGDRDRARLRSLVGAGAALWAGPGGVRIEPGRWVALSGARAVDYNVVLCHASFADPIAAGLEEISRAGAPALMIVAGEALGDVQELAAHGWVCVGAVPFMVRELEPGTEPAADSGVRRLGAGELDAARAIVAGSFGLDDELARVALPDDAVTRPGQSVWGAFGPDGELVACLAAVVHDDAIVIWSMASEPTARRQGHGARLLRAVLSDAAASGAACSLLYSSRAAEQFYRSLGFRELEWWQLWSRPRWVLGRA